MTRLPIRVRVAIAFAAAIAALMVAVGLFVYLRLGAELDASIDQGLRSRAGELASLIRTSGPVLGSGGGDGLIEAEESFAQVVDGSGDVLDSTPQVGSEPVLAATELDSVAAPAFFERGGIPGVEGPARLLATPVEAEDGLLYAIVGSSLEDRDEALANLARLLLVGGLVALLVAAIAGYALAAAALRPVEAMRARASAISASRPGERLPLPAGDDELRRLGETLNAMLARLERAIERERRFVDDASHELRTPLTLHKTELELALRHGSGAGELRASIASAIIEADRLIDLAEDLLIVARSDEHELDPEAIPCDELLATVARRFRQQGQGRVLAVDGAGLVAVGDRRRLERALTNLVGNALRHGRGEVGLFARGSPGGIELHVVDHGPGFAPEFIDRAFERFSRADEARGRGGAGLGLAIVERIASAHGGSAGAANRPGGGADVWIEVPAADV